jgi:hypothetical protein
MSTNHLNYVDSCYEPLLDIYIDTKPCVRALSCLWKCSIQKLPNIAHKILNICLAFVEQKGDVSMSTKKKKTKEHCSINGSEILSSEISRNL